MVRTPRIRCQWVAWGVLLLGIAAHPTWAWDPDAGDWSKSDTLDLRVMTYNVRDHLRSLEPKTEGLNGWTALARIVAAMQPDFLLLQETADNGCFKCADSASTMETVLELFMHGGEDPFLGGEVSAYVQKYAPDYDLPWILPSLGSDGFNRNAILSRYPLTDLNGDTLTNMSQTPIQLSDAYAPGGNGGIRGFAFAEFALPNALYAGDVVIGNAHLKAGGGADDLLDRLRASQNVAYLIDYWFNGAGSGVPDPNGSILESPEAQSILAAATAVVVGGDWNEDEQTNGRRGPAAWLTEAEFSGDTDGTDRDRSDATFDAAVHPFTGSRATLGGSKLDYVAWQDSIVDLRRAFVFNTSGTPTAALPAELSGFQVPGAASSLASDHRPVIADLILPLAEPSACVGYEACADSDGNGLRDDGCLWWDCVASTCVATPLTFGDVGGASGACAPDGAADANDRFHALNCFSNSDTFGVSAYPCETAPPQAFNVDAGGPFGSCAPDGVCDGHDAFHALNAFEGVSTCTCAPLPRAPGARRHRAP